MYYIEVLHICTITLFGVKVVTVERRLSYFSIGKELKMEQGKPKGLPEALKKHAVFSDRSMSAALSHCYNIKQRPERVKR